MVSDIELSSTAATGFNEIPQKGQNISSLAIFSPHSGQ
jgi:hypothetical protein